MILGHGHKLIAYGIAVVTATMLHRPLWLALGLGGVLLLSGAGRGALLLRALKGVLLIMVLISSGYLLMASMQGTLNPEYLLLFNLRVLLLACLTAWIMRDVDLDLALARFPEARRWLAVVRIQIQLFQRLLRDYRQAQKSRSTVTPGLASRYRAAGALGIAALDKAVHNAEEVTQGMRSRGAFDD
jgi:cobalt/nickel transport system permease protein